MFFKEDEEAIKASEEESQQEFDETVDSNSDSEDLQTKLKEQEEKILRLAADFENTKKRLQNRSEEMVKFANENLIESLLSVLDDLDRAMTSVDQGHDVKTVQEGLHLVQNNFHKVLEQNGVESIECLKKSFDPNLHEAIAEVSDDEVEEGHIVSEVQKGYLLNGRLIRPSRVTISKKD